MRYLGVDLGQRADFTAVAVVEREEAARRFDYLDWRTTVERGRRLVVRHLERMRLGTPYPEVTRRIGEVAGRLGQCRVAVDATGVGGPVVDMLRASRAGWELMPVVITGGQGERYDGRGWLVPKVDLMAGLQAGLETGELKIARGMRMTGELVRELVGMRARLGARGVKVGAEGSGEHDDLVMAVALACWAARKAGAGERGERLVGI